MRLLGDRALLDGFRRGDRAALTRVYREYTDVVTEFVACGARLRVAGAAARIGALDVEAAHQETFMRAFSPPARAAYDGLRPYQPYLLTIARSATADVLRKRGRVAAESVTFEEVPPGALALSACEPSPEQAALHNETRGLVSKFLTALPSDERQLVVLRYSEGVTQEVVARTLGLSRSELRTRESKLKQKLAAFLEKAGWSDGGS